MSCGGHSRLDRRLNSYCRGIWRRTLRVAAAQPVCDRYYCTYGGRIPLITSLCEDARLARFGETTSIHIADPDLVFWADPTRFKLERVPSIDPAVSYMYQGSTDCVQHVKRKLRLWRGRSYNKQRKQPHSVICRTSLRAIVVTDGHIYLGDCVEVYCR